MLNRLFTIGQRTLTRRVESPAVKASSPLSAGYRLAGPAVIAATLVAGARGPVMDLKINAARDGRQTHMECDELFDPLALQGWEPITIRTNSAAEKSAKRRMG
jgi:hypothetical protein